MAHEGAVDIHLELKEDTGRTGPGAVGTQDSFHELGILAASVADILESWALKNCDTMSQGNC